MSIEDDPEKPREDDDAQVTPEWHRAWAKQLRENGCKIMWLPVPL